MRMNPFAAKGASEGEPSRFRIPDGVRVYAIGDVHGHRDLLEALLAAIDEDLAQSPVERALEITLGDYIDRGPDSRGVLQLLSTRPPSGRTRISLRGNHEDFLLAFVKNPGVLYGWAQNGGIETLGSYGVHVARGAVDPAAVHMEFLAALPEHHLSFLQGLALTHREGDVLCVHAGIRPGVPLDAQDPDDLTTIRRAFLESDDALPVRVVHGHTPTETPTVTPYRIGIDTGAFATGVLTCCALEGGDYRFIQVER